MPQHPAPESFKATVTPAAGVALHGPLAVSAQARVQPELDRALNELKSNAPAGKTAARLDLEGLTAFDTLGALWLHQFIVTAKEQGQPLKPHGLLPQWQQLLATTQEAMSHFPPEPPAPHRSLQQVIFDAIVTVGEGVYGFRNSTYNIISLFGQLVLSVGPLARGKEKFRLNAFVRHVRETGLSAVPIVGLISFLISIVLMYQGATALQTFGAPQYSINLVAISVLREMGGLLAAIMVAGRSGSAFASEIGVMKLREEVDAMRVMGLTPLNVLVLPRVLALVLVLPLLTFVAFVAGLIGGGLIAYFQLGIGFGAYLDRFQNAVSLSTMVIGLVKAPFFALFIALIGCQAGLEVEGSAESLGRLTTRAVVQGIFTVLVLDAAFSIFFAKMDW